MQMLRSMKDIQGYVLGAQDGEIGRCSDFLFDDKDWAVRYIVADTKKWLPGRKVLISPISIGDADGVSQTLNVGLTKEQIENSPPLETNAPVSRRYEVAFNKFFDWAHYWAGPSVWGEGLYPRLLQRNEEELASPQRHQRRRASASINSGGDGVSNSGNRQRHRPHRRFHCAAGRVDHPIPGDRHQQLAAGQQTGIGGTDMGRLRGLGRK